RLIKINQIRDSGFEILNELKNISVLLIISLSVVNGTMSLGMLLSVSYIIGQMDPQLKQIIDFFRLFQDANLSMARLNEVEATEPEENSTLIKFPQGFQGIPFKRDFFQYGGSNSPYVLKNVNLKIPNNKTTAIVGGSGSGKTSLLKLILKYQNTNSGTILINQKKINLISPKELRKNFGVVLQNGFIFSDTITRNIVMNNTFDENRLKHACKMANINEFIQNLPLGYKTKIGASGVGLS